MLDQQIRVLGVMTLIPNSLALYSRILFTGSQETRIHGFYTLRKPTVTILSSYELALSNKKRDQRVLSLAKIMNCGGDLPAEFDNLYQKC